MTATSGRRTDVGDGGMIVIRSSTWFITWQCNNDIERCRAINVEKREQVRVPSELSGPKGMPPFIYLDEVKVTLASMAKKSRHIVHQVDPS